MFRCRSFLPKIWMKMNCINIGKGLRVFGWPIVFRFPNAHIEIGKNVTINSSMLSNLLGLYQRMIIVARGTGRIDIGDRVGMSGSTIYARDQITIGDDTLIGANGKIIDNDFHPIDPEERLSGSLDRLKTRPVVIGKNVFIGCNSIILKGTQIGDNCVVGAGSVVSGVFGPNLVIAGNPARVIRTLDESSENHSSFLEE